jgi:hypothetical protein
MACGARGTNLYPAGCNPVPRSLMRVARVRAPRGMGPFSTAAFFIHVEIRSHIRLGSQKSALRPRFTPITDSVLALRLEPRPELYAWQAQLGTFPARAHSEQTGGAILSSSLWAVWMINAPGAATPRFRQMVRALVNQAIVD